MDMHDDGSHLNAWPAFVDLLAAMALLFVTLVTVLLYVAHLRQARAEADAQGLRTERQDLVRKLEEARGDDTAFAVYDDSQFVRITLRDEATFKRGEYRRAYFHPDGRKALSRIGAILKDPAVAQLYRRVHVVGHTDTAPYAGDDFTNWELSAARAAVVARILVHEERVDACKVSASGVGPYYPAKNLPASLSPEDRDRKNRRIEIEIVPRRASVTATDTSCRRDLPGSWSAP